MSTEYLVHLTDCEGHQASVCAMRIQGGSRDNAIRLAAGRKFKNFNVIERADSPEGFSDQRVATVRFGHLVTGTPHYDR